MGWGCKSIKSFLALPPDAYRESLIRGRLERKTFEGVICGQIIGIAPGGFRGGAEVTRMKKLKRLGSSVCEKLKSIKSFVICK